MKTKLIITLLLGFILLETTAQLPKLYINLVSHNEENYTYLANSPSFYSVRTKIKTLANLVTIKGAKWHLGSDHILLRAAIAYDTGIVQGTTGGMNILKYITSSYPNNVECDPHAHESIYNYADIAKLHDSLGLNPGTVMSGFLYNTLQSGNDWGIYQNPGQGLNFPNYTWAPEILWGAGSPNHVSDPVSYGMWKPKDLNNFYVHQSSNHLINYGQGCKIEMHDTTNIANVMTQIRYIVNAIQTGIAPSTGFYCTSIFFRESYLTSPGFITTKMDDLMDSINVLVAQNKVEWLFIPEVVNRWKTNYGSQPFIMDCDLTLTTSAVENNSSEQRINAFPNPSNGIFSFKNETTGTTEIQVYDMLGKIVYQTSIKGALSANIDLSKQPSGVYFVRALENNRTSYNQKIILAK